MVKIQFDRMDLSRTFDQCLIEKSEHDTVYSKKLIIDVLKHLVLKQFRDEVDYYPDEVERLARNYFKSLETTLGLHRLRYGMASAPSIGR